MKKLSLLFMALVATTALWAADFTIDGIAYNKLGGDSVEVTSKSPRYSSYVSIPSIVTFESTTYRVTSIGSSAFSGCSIILFITISNSVTSIGHDAFYGCASLYSITIPNSVTSIGAGAFCCCISLSSITIGNSVTSIGDRAFESCTSLTSVNIPNSVTSIGDMAFSFCTSLTSINVDAANTHYASVDGVLFNYAKDTLIQYPIRNTRTEYTIPNSVTSFENCAFRYCTFLHSITVPNGVTSIGEMAFYKCTSLSSITIGNSVTSIGDEAFKYCTSLNSITIPNSVKSIGDNTFAYCTSLTSITIGNSVTSIGDYAFYYTSPTSITIGNSVTSIGDYAFSDCTSLSSITIPNSVTSIGEGAFAGCRSLTSITIPNSVTSIGESAFYGCTSLTSINVDAANTHYASVDGVLFNYAKDTLIQYPIGNKRTTYTIPNSVTNIGDGAFSFCTSLTSVTIPNSVTSIEEGAFDDCTSLTSVTCYATTPPDCYDCFDNVDMSIPLYVPNKSIKDYQNTYQWKDFTNIQPIIYGTVTTSVNNPLWGSVSGGGIQYDSICTLTASAYFRYCFTQWSDGNTENPRSIILTQDTTFEAWFDIAQSGTCGDNLTWQYTKGTLAISGTGDMYSYTRYSVPWLLFRDSITNIVIANGATSVGDYAFYACANKNFKTLTLPNSIETIGESAFAECTYLKNITLGTNLENIGNKAFDNDLKLLYFTCYAMEPPTLATNAFVNWDAYLSVPCEVLDDYKVSVGWKLFTKENVRCIGAESTTTTTVTVTPDETTATITWPTNSDAESYTLVIKKDGATFCTLTFNAQGQLMNIAFAPGRGGSNDVTMAEAVTGGYKFTITSLTPGAKYTYNIDTKDAAGTTIKNYTGEFMTKPLTALEETSFPSGEERGEAAKVIKDNQLLILRDGKTYNAQGSEVK